MSHIIDGRLLWDIYFLAERNKKYHERYFARI